MFEHFTTEGRGIVVDAQLQARRLGHEYVGCEHLLLAVASTEGEIGQTVRDLGLTPDALEAAIRRLVGGHLFEGVDGAALAAIGIDIDAVRAKVEADFGPASVGVRPRRWRRGRRRTCRSSTGPMAFTPRAKKCLQLSRRELLAQGDREIRTEHIALALSSMNDGIIPDLLSAVGVSGAVLRTAILERRRRAG